VLIHLFSDTNYVRAGFNLSYSTNLSALAVAPQLPPSSDWQLLGSDSTWASIGSSVTLNAAQTHALIFGGFNLNLADNQLRRVDLATGDFSALPNDNAPVCSPLSCHPFTLGAHIRALADGPL
jgi:hypothetical protein